MSCVGTHKHVRSCTMHELHGAAIRRLEGEHAIAEVVEQVLVLLHVVADDGRLVQRQRRARPRRGVEQHHAFRGRVHGPPVVLRRHYHVAAAAAEVQHQRRHHPTGVSPRDAQVQPFDPRPHEAGAQLAHQLRPQRLVCCVDEARERGTGVDHHAAGPHPRRDLPEAERRRGDGEPGAAHGHPDQGQVVERAEGVLLGVLGERHGCHRRVAAVQAGGRADEQVARVDGGVARVGREAVGELGVAELGDQRERAAAEPDDTGRAVQGARREPRRGDAPEREPHLLRPEREHLGAQEPRDVAGGVADDDGARPAAAAARAAPGLGAGDGAHGAVARHGLGGARAGGVVVGEVLAEAAGAAGGALRPDEVAASVDDGLGKLRRVADEVLGDVLRLRPADGRGHPAAHGRQAAAGALDGAAHALLAGAAVLGVDVGELEAEAGRGGGDGDPPQGGAEERETEQRLRHSYLK
ncbi:hypothetical protein PVAP13_3KG493001 [Panicum virgatum]|uniref:Uncharacterized protein n=1 Tax=Panicum virgatum TaxID=38727 RepID=A0A8T0V4D9_PANVG|nr:hypothetical protein PVAP13_3KG493001 [Panicum virgatum]